MNAQVTRSDLRLFAHAMSPADRKLTKRARYPFDQNQATKGRRVGLTVIKVRRQMEKLRERITLTDNAPPAFP